MTPAPQILVLYAHPAHHRSRVNRRLFEEAKQLPNVRAHDLYQTYPDFHIDVEYEQELLTQSDLIVFQHPMFWYSMPALLKEWVDVVFEHGWAYGHEGHALRGKDFWLVATTGGSTASYSTEGYHRRPFADFLPPYQQTAFLCGMRWNEPLVFHGARRANDAEIGAHALRYVELLARYPAWQDLPQRHVPPLVPANEYIHDPDER